MSDQDNHDYKRKVAPPLKPVTRQQLEDSLTMKNGSSMEPPSFAMTGPVAAILRDHPNLTPEAAVKQIQSLGW